MSSYPRIPGHTLAHAHSLPCVVTRTRLGHLCGYVGLPPGHPWHGVHYSLLPVDVHGDVTYSKLDGEGTWWVGWDDAHWHRFSGDHMAETERLAEQLAAARGPLLEGWDSFGE